MRVSSRSQAATPPGRVPRVHTSAERDRDGHPDLLVAWGSHSTPAVFLFDAGQLALRPPTAEEPRQLWLLGMGP